MVQNFDSQLLGKKGYFVKFLNMNEQEIKQLKVFFINSIQRMKRKQNEVLEELLKEKRAKDLLTVKQVAEEYSFSQKTVYRMRDNGLVFLQNGTDGKLLFKRENLENYLKTKSYGRWN